MRVWIILAYLLIGSVLPSVAATRLGLHGTQEELWCGRQRAGIDAQGPNGVTCPIAYVSGGDVQANSPGDWNKIVADKEAFRANTTLGCWSGPAGCSAEPSWTTANCVDNAEMGLGTNAANFPGYNNSGIGDEARNAALFAMINPGHATAADAASKVRTFLLNHANATKLNFANKSLFCEGDVTGDGNPRFEMATWLMKLLHAYEYLQIYGNITGGDATILNAWFLGAGQWFRGMTFGAAPFTSSNYSNVFVGQEASYPTTVAVGLKYSGTLGGGFGSCPMPTPHLNMYDGSPLIAENFYVCANRGMHLNAFTMNVGVKFANAELIRHSKEWIQSCLVYSIWPNGDDQEFFRVYDNALDDEDHGHQYQGFKLGSVMDAVDVLARSGDFSLYTYSTSDGV